jgi:acyl-CoA reductase-like NAD-dependent aldehyde dehydrogenase
MSSSVQSRTFSPLMVRGLLKACDVYVPGFSRTGYIHEVDRIADFMTASDRSGVQALAAVLALLPRFAVRLLLAWADRSVASGAPWAPVLRQLHLGLKGLAMSLYYSDVANDGEVFRRIGWDVRCGEDPPASPAAAAFARARSGQSFLRKLSPAERLAHLRRLKAVILEEQDRIVAEVERATGKARTDVLVSEIFGVLDHLAYLERSAAAVLADRKAHTPPVLMGKRSKVFFEPLGTVLVISPWNYPFYQAIVPITSALVCGNTVVYKPSEHTPLTGLVESLLEKAGLPRNWVQVVYGAGAVGEELIGQGPEKIFFTGSTRTGKRIMALAAEQLIPVELELGGKDPMIVFEDANLERAVAGAAWGALTNGGQSCTSVERLYVHEAIFETFKARLQVQFERIRVGPPGEGWVDVGAMTNDQQTAVVARHVEAARTAGARILTGGGWDGRSRLVPPILMDRPAAGLEVGREETFGPVLPIYAFRTEEEAVALANDSAYGLSASVWSADLRRAERVARGLVTGNVSINNVMVTEGNHALPFGGTRRSGFGRYKGEFGLYAFSNVKAIMVEPSSAKIEANWFPYDGEKYRLFQELIRAVFGSSGLVGLVRFAWAGFRLERHAARAAAERARQG